MRGSLLGLLRRLRPPLRTRTPARTMLMMGPYDPHTPDDEEPGIKVRVKQEVPDEAKLSFRQRMADWRARHRPEPPACDIGLPRSLLTASRPELPDQNRQQELERLARNQQLRVDLDAVELAWESESRPEHALTAARHCAIMEHLFGPGCFFYPVVPLRAHFADPSLPGRVRPVALGNIMTPRQCSEAPELCWQEPQDCGSPGQQQLKWTVLLTCPDEHLQSAEREYAHWLVTDIPGSGRLSEGHPHLPYLQPIPPLGTGLHRYALILFLQSGPLNLPADRQLAADRLADRDFSTAEFYRRHQDQLTPAGLCFFQAAWDESVRAVYRQRLADVGAEPVFEFSWPAPYRPQMRQFAFSEPFNLYLDKYRDVKDIAEETLKEKLKSVHPFLGRRRPESKYPLAVPAEGYQPTWLKERETQKILHKGQWRDLD